MSDRGMPIADGAPACPFVAFDDDRDERATVPDHRHRCYADARPSPRALAHQEAYCLSSAFPVCPTFQDWARRESARARADAQAREDADAADRRAAATGSIAGAGAAVVGQGATAWPGADDGAMDAAPAVTDGDPATDDGDRIGRGAADDDAQDDDHEDDRAPYGDEGPRRNPPREWSAPPPWLASSEAARGAHNAPPPDFLARRANEPGQGLVGSAADQLAGGPPPPPPKTDPRPRFEAQMPGVEELDPSDAPSPRRPRAYDQHLGGPSSGPDWERPRRYEAYPTIKTRVGMPAIPRIAFLGLLIVVGTLAFFFLPAFLGLGGNTGAPPASILLSPSPSESLEPTPVPAATPILYTIKKGETLSKIATAHGITLEQLLAANKTIKNPNKITEGQQITIPLPEGDVPVDGSPSASGAASP